MLRILLKRVLKRSRLKLLARQVGIVLEMVNVLNVQPAGTGLQLEDPGLLHSAKAVVRQDSIARLGH